MLSPFVFSETSPAAASTVASSGNVQNANPSLPAGVAGPLDDVQAIVVTATLQGGTGGTLDVYLQFSPDEGVSWWDAVHFPQLANGAAAINYTCTLGGEQNTITVVGTGLTPALAANTVAVGGWGSRMRMVMVAGSGTNAGALQKITLLGQRPEMGRRY